MKLLVTTVNKVYKVNHVSGTMNDLLETLSRNKWWVFDDDIGAVFLNTSQIISVRVCVDE